MTEEMEKLFSEEFRLKTFKDHGWRLTHLKPETLAKCGFFYLGDGDRVQCPFCGIVIFNWQCGDEPIFEHKIHSGKCPFINGQDVGNIFLEIDPRDIYGLTQSQDVCGFSHPIVTQTKEETNVKPSDGPGIVFKAPKAGEFITYESRLASFVEWPIPNIISPAQLAESGFYFKGPVISFDRDYQDYVTCFHCGIGLCQWTEEDDPWLEHRKFNPECSFLHLVSRQPPEEKPLTASSTDEKPLNETSTDDKPSTASSTDEKPLTEVPTDETPLTAASIEETPLTAASSDENPLTETSTDEKPLTASSTDEKPSTATSPPVSSPSIQLKPFIPYTWLPQPEQEDLCCNVCLDFQMGATFYPCLHSSCVLCAASLSNCPLCRSNIERVIKLEYESKTLQDVKTVSEEEKLPLIAQLAPTDSNTND